MKNKILLSLIGALLAFSSFLMGKVNPPKLGAVGSDARACQIATSTVMVIGKDVPTFIAATSSSRAYLTLEPISQATSTFALAFNGKVATTGSNLILPNGVGYSRLVGAQASTSIYFAGLATENPYVGAISAISLFGTTTGLVTECRYQ